MFFLGNVSAISCTCSSCDSCTAALNDNINCPLGVNLTADITDYAGTCINNSANFSNKIFDCQGHIIDGDDIGEDYGIYLYGKENNTIKNCVITDFYYGIYLESSSNNTLTDNTASSNSYGILLDYSSNNILTNNTASSNSYDGISLYSSSNNTLTNNTANSNNNTGIYLESSSNNTLTDNNLSYNQYGIYLISSSNNTLTDNAMNNNIYDNFGIYGSQISDYYQDINTSNTVDGKPIYYWTNEKNAPNNCKNAEINEANNAGFVALISCDNITVRNLNLEYNSHGVLLVNTVNSKISDVNASLNDYGIYLYYSSNNTLSNITANSNIEGIYLYNSSDNTLVNITANSNYYNGIYLYFSDNNILNSNRICKNNEVGLDFYDDISNKGLGNSGDNNVCDTVYNWNDFSTWSCKYTCDGKQRVIFTFPFYFGWNLFSFPVST